MPHGICVRVEKYSMEAINIDGKNSEQIDTEVYTHRHVKSNMFGKPSSA